MPDINQNKKKAILEQRDAEQKILCNDHTGARDNLLMAQKLFPAIDNIGAMLVVCDILSASNINLSSFLVMELITTGFFSLLLRLHFMLLNIVTKVSIHCYNLSRQSFLALNWL